MKDITECIQISCCGADAGNFSPLTYSLVSGESYQNNEFTLVVDCPPGYLCLSPTITITLPPGSIIFTPTDFEGPTTPGNGPGTPQAGTYVFKCGSEKLVITTTEDGFTDAQIVQIVNFLANCVAENEGITDLQPKPPPVPPSGSSAPPVIGELSVRKGCQNATFVSIINITSNAAPATIEITSGSLPPGLAMVQTGPLQVQIFGTPTTTGSFPFLIKATDAMGNIAGKNFTIGIIGIANSSPLPSATSGAAYSETLTAAGPATAPITWAITAGALPDGLTLNTSTGEIFGTPTSEGNYSFTVSMTSV